MPPPVPTCMTQAPTLDPRAPSPAIQARHLLLLNPFYAKDPVSSFGKHVLTPSLALTSIAGATPPDWSVDYWDENLLQGPPPLDPMPQVVGITVHLTFARRAIALAWHYRSRGAVVVMGGLHVQSCAEELRAHADILVVGEGTQVWPEVLRDVARGRWQDTYTGSFARSYHKDPAPRRSVLSRSSYLTTASVIATRGCHNRCGFCYLSTDGLHMPYQCRDVHQVVQDIQDQDQPYAVFLDNNLGSRPEYLRQLCYGLRPLERIWSAAVTIDVTDDPRLVRDMARAGCTGVFVGFESLHAANLRDARKKTPAPEDYARRVRIFHEHGIQVNGSFVLGFDHDGPDVFQRTVDWVEAQRLECATFHILTPYPGTALFRQWQSEGRLLHEDFDRYDTAHAVFRPARMTAEQLEEGYAWCYRRLFSSASIWRRRPQHWRAVLPYLGMSYLYKRGNWLWPFLIRRRLTHRLWHPLVEWSRRRHARQRRRAVPGAEGPTTGGAPVSAGV